MRGFCRPPAILLALLLLGTVAAQEDESEGTSLAIRGTAFSAELSGGFNYDLLRNPLDVSFDRPRGYISLNMPFRFAAPKALMNQMSESVSDFLTEDGEPFEPTAAAKQYANSSFMVDVPMFGGVASFANTQNMFLRYTNILGAPDAEIPVESETMNLFLRGSIGVPMDLQMGWESMTFGYAFKVNDDFRLAFNIHRHSFHFSLRARVDVDLLGYMEIGGGQEDGGSSPLAPQVAEVDYSSDKVYGSAGADYSVNVWSPTLALKYRRFSLISRFGFNTKATGTPLSATYSLPILLTRDFQLQTEEFLIKNQERIRNNETHSFSYSSKEDLHWKLPSGHTIAFDIIKERLSLSYTKLVGDIELGLPNIVETIRSEETGEQSTDTADLDIGVTVDHVLLLSGTFDHAFFNLGIFGMDLRFSEETNLLEQIQELPNFGGGTLLPILSFGSTMGSKMRLLLEVDLLPLAAVKAGIVYYFQ